MGYPCQYSWAFLVAQLVKNPPAMRETWVQFLGWEDTLEKGKATLFSILACSPWGCKKSAMTERLSLHFTWTPQCAFQKNTVPESFASEKGSVKENKFGKLDYRKTDRLVNQI